jgi:hypothetical protein
LVVDAQMLHSIDFWMRVIPKNRLSRCRNSILPRNILFSRL